MKKFLTTILTLSLLVSLGTGALANNEINLISKQLYQIVNQVPSELQEYIEEHKYEQGYHMISENGLNYLLITLGQRNTGGYSLEIKDFFERDGKAFFRVAEISPDSDSFVTQVITYPYLIIELLEDYDDVEVSISSTTEYNHNKIDDSKMKFPFENEELTYVSLLTDMREANLQVVSRNINSDGNFEIYYLSRDEDATQQSHIELKEKYAEIIFIEVASLPDYTEGIELEDFEIIKEADQSVEQIIENNQEHRGFTIIDRDGQKLVLITMGEKRTGGYFLEVESVTKHGKVLVVTVSEHEPDGPAIMVITYPYILVDPQVEFEFVRVVDTKNNSYDSHEIRQTIIDDAHLLPVYDIDEGTRFTPIDKPALLEIETRVINRVYYAPLRAAANALGFEVNYIARTNSVLLRGNQDFTINLTDKTINGDDLPTTNIDLFVENGTTIVNIEVFNLIY